ncbi:CDP-glycerol glycerophosphotransferase family protein [uncultured Jatrophihabitans sp.]|uniref:CDP-glycerol glycerophosphotransferase family protein n=1 Tax=uncultured Jatrophihabitans sp. TaxID=1610747 RepID=UPI0035CBB11D
MPSGPRARVRKIARRVQVAAQYERIAYGRRAPVDESRVVYESFSGNGMLCNPEAIFRALLAAPDLAHLKHTWVLSDFEQYAATIAEFADDPRVDFVEAGTHTYYAALARAKYLVNNATFPQQFGKREGQVYLNTWHGTPLKAMGYDIPGGAIDTRNVVRNLLSADYLLAPNDDTRRMYLDGYRMTNIYRGALLETGTPRIDRQRLDDAGSARIKDRLRAGGVVLDDAQEVVVYAPTWRGNFYAPTNDIRQLRTRIEAVSAQLDRSRYRLLLKVHQQVYKHAVSDPKLREMLVPNEVPTNEVLGITDVLVTDYSSIFVDFLATGRPVLFFAPDIDDYQANRGLYLPVAEWPGPVSRDVEGLVSDIKHLGTQGPQDPAVVYADRYRAARERYCGREDGHAAQRVVDVVFRGRQDPAVVRGFADGRTSVLIHLGGMLDNGITTSALCLLDNIDHDRFDVSVTFGYTANPARLRQFAKINPRVRLLPRIGGINGTKVQVKSLLSKNQIIADPRFSHQARHRALLREEWVRCFGHARFEHVVDFSGYSPFWLKLLINRPGGTLSVWLHNDILAEVGNPDRSKAVRESVSSAMVLYGLADRLVSVSAALDEVNQRGLADLAPAAAFTYARNTINVERIKHMATGAPAPTDHPEGVPTDEPTTQLSGPVTLPEAVARLMAVYGADDVRDEVERRETLSTVLPPLPGVRTFVTAGRLSAEKNHTRMIKAFARVHQEDPAVRLIILGRGPLRERLMALVEELGLTSAVNLAGHQNNPHAIVANSDCFVLSSDYEGQPMVLLEAMVLGRPVVTTAFDSVRGALPEGYGRVVERKVGALADGLRAFLRGEVSSLPFDGEAYNRDATLEFYRAIGVDDAGAATPDSIR